MMVVARFLVMADPNTMPPPPQSPPVWMPAPVGHAMAPRMDMMPMASLLGRIIGFALLFIGTLVAVVFASYGGGCYTAANSCNANTLAAAANGILTARILWVIGLFFLGAAAGLKLHFGLRAPTSGRAEDYQFVIADRRFNGLLFLVSIVLLLVVLVNLSGPGYPTGIFP